MGFDDLAEIRRRLDKTDSTVATLLTRLEVAAERIGRMEKSLGDTTHALQLTLDHLDNIMRGDGGNMVGLTGRIDRVEQFVRDFGVNDARRHAFWSKLTIGAIVAILSLAAERVVSYVSGRNP